MIGHAVKCRNKYKKYLEQEHKRIVPLDEDEQPREIEITDGKDEFLSEPQEEPEMSEERPKIPESESGEENDRDFQSLMMFRPRDHQRARIQMIVQRQSMEYVPNPYEPQRG